MMLRNDVIALAFLLAGSGHAEAQILDLAELTTHQIESLDRDSTVVLIPGGILEQHGPYLPSFTDGYLSQDWAERLSDAIAATGRTVLLFPQIPLGVGGANEIGMRYVFPGTYAVRSETLRAVFMDIASELGEQGFKWVFVVHLHGAPNQNRALDQAAAFFSDEYQGQMVHLWNLLPTGMSQDERPEHVTEEDGFSPHGGTIETGWIMSVREDLISENLSMAQDLTAANWLEILEIASRPDWPGYFGAPRHATPEVGADHWRRLTDWYIDTALAILKGLDPASLPKRTAAADRNPMNRRIDEAALAREEELQARQEAWLNRRGG